MKKKLILGLTTLLLLSGCGKESEPEETYDVYQCQTPRGTPYEFWIVNEEELVIKFYDHETTYQYNPTYENDQLVRFSIDTGKASWIFPVYELNESGYRGRDGTNTWSYNCYLKEDQQ